MRAAPDSGHVGRARERAGIPGWHCCLGPSSAFALARRLVLSGPFLCFVLEAEQLNWPSGLGAKPLRCDCLLPLSQAGLASEDHQRGALLLAFSWVALGEVQGRAADRGCTLSVTEAQNEGTQGTEVCFSPKSQ